MSKRLVAVLALLGLAVAGAVVASAATPATAGASAGTAPGGSYVALTPTRILDTRSGPGAARAATQQVTVNTAGVAGIPSSGVSAVAVNLAVTAPTGPGFLVGYAAGTSRPATSNANYLTNQTVAALSIVPVNSAGAFTVYSSARAQLIADVVGYFTTSDAATPSGRFTTVAATRLVDTRTHHGATAPGPGGVATVQVTGTPGIPAGGVTAVVVNTTVVAPTASGYVTAYPAGTEVPHTATINFSKGELRVNRAIVPIGQDGKISFYNATGTTQLVVDVDGYFSSSGSYYVAGTPTRLLDSRNSSRPWSTSANATNALGVTIDAPAYPNETGRVQSTADITPTTAVWLTLTAVNPTTSGFATAYPSTAPRPATSDLNPIAGRATSNAAVVAPGSDGNINIYSSAAQQFVVDLDGYFAAAALARTTAGVWAWGGSLPTGTFSINSIADAKTIVTDASGYEYALRADGSLIAWPDPTYTNDRLTRHTFHYDVSSHITQLAGTQVAGGSAVYALHSDGTVVAWGHDHYGEFGDGSHTDTLFITFGSGDGTMAPTSGKVQLSDVTLIGAGFYTGYAMKSDGTVWAWGAGGSGALGNGTTSDSYLPVPVTGLTDIRSIAGGAGPAYAIDSSGHLWRWGAITTTGGSQIVTVPTQVSLGCGDGKSLFTDQYGSWELCTDGTVWRLDDAGREAANGTTFAGPIPSLTDITALAAARTATLGDHRTALQALDAGGRVWRFDTAANAYTPIPDLSGVTAIGGGGTSGRAVYAVAGG
jgi:regulator of chromosome condensation (RCC1) repeat-containing protein